MFASLAIYAGVVQCAPTKSPKATNASTKSPKATNASKSSKAPKNRILKAKGDDSMSSKATNPTARVLRARWLNFTAALCCPHIKKCCHVGAGRTKNVLNYIIIRRNQRFTINLSRHCGFIVQLQSYRTTDFQSFPTDPYTRATCKQVTFRLRE